MWRFRQFRTPLLVAEAEDRSRLTRDQPELGRATITKSRLGIDEYAAPFAGDVARIAEDDDIVAVLASQLDQVLARLTRVSEARGEYRYAPEKWSVKQVIGHLSDTERVGGRRPRAPV